MVEISSYYFEKLSEEENSIALVSLDKVRKAEENWLSSIETLLPVKAKIRFLVDYIDTNRGKKSTVFFDKLSKKIKLSLNVDHINDKVKEADGEYKRLKEESKSLYEKEAKARETLADTEFEFACILYQGDDMMADFFTKECEEERKKFIEETINKYIIELKKTALQ